MRSTVATISSLLLGIGLLMLGNGLLGTLLGVRMALAELSPITIGLVMAGYFMGLALGALLGHGVIAAVGHIRAFSAFASLYSAVSLAHAFLFEPLFWCLLRILQGFCMAGLFMCVESWLNVRATNETRGQIMSVYMIVLYAAQGLGQYFLTQGAPDGFMLYALVSAIVSLAVVPVALTGLPAPPSPQPTRLSLRRLYLVSPLGMFGAFASGLVVGAFYGMGPAFAPMAGMDLAETALFMALVILGGLAMQWPIGRLSDSIDRRAVILGAAVAVAVISLGLALAAGRSHTGVLIGGILFGACGFVLYPLSVAHANDVIEPGEFVALAAGLLLAYSFGAIGGPIGAAAVMAFSGPGGLFLFTAVVAGAAGGFTLWRIKQRPSLPVEEQQPFMGVPRTTSAAAGLDPRGPESEAEIVENAL